jgi:hypothetical protein
MFLQKHPKTTPMEAEEGLWKINKSFFRNSTIKCSLILVWEYVKFVLEFFDRIDFVIIAFEGRRKCFFRPCLARSAALDSCLCHKLEVYKTKLLKIHNVWHVRYLWKNS